MYTSISLSVLFLLKQLSPVQYTDLLVLVVGRGQNQFSPWGSPSSPSLHLSHCLSVSVSQPDWLNFHPILLLLPQM